MSLLLSSGAGGGGPAAELVASMTGSGGMVANLTTAIALAASLSGTGTVQSSLTTQITPAAVMQGTGTVVAELTTAIPLAASMTGTGTVIAPLTTAIALESLMTGTGSLVSDLSTQIALASSLQGTGTLLSVLTTEIPLESSLQGTGTVVADLSTQILFAASLTGEASLVSSLTTAIPFEAVMTGTATLIGNIPTAAALESSFTGTATLEALLDVSRPIRRKVLRYEYAHTDSRLPPRRIPQFILCDQQADLPIINVGEGDLAFAKDTDTLWKRTADAWVEVEGGGGVGGPPVVLRPAQITANVNDYNPGACDILMINTDASRNVTGLQAGTIDGEARLVINNGVFPVILTHQDSLSAAANRFICQGGADIVLPGDFMASMIYDLVADRWRVVAE